MRCAFVFLLTTIVLILGCSTFHSMTETKPRIISSTGTRYDNPSFAPDGDHIVFVGRDTVVTIFTCKTDGSDFHVLTQIGEKKNISGVSITSDLKYILFCLYREGQTDIWRLDLESKELINLTDNPADDSYFVLSPDGKYLAYIKSEEPSYDSSYSSFIYLKGHGRSFLMVMNIDGSGGRVVAENGWNPIWSPDGTFLAYHTEDAEHIWGVDGTDEIHKPAGYFWAWGCDCNSMFVGVPWKISGFKKFVNGFCGTNIFTYYESRDLHYMSMDGAIDLVLLSNVYAELAYRVPAGRMALAVWPYLGEISYDGIVLVDCTGHLIADYRQQGPGFEYGSISWSPDGQSVVFSRHTRDWVTDPGLGGIFILSVTDGNLRQIISDKIEWSTN